MKEIDDLVGKAKRFMHTAEYALSTGDYGSCASRGYYAMFSMAEAILLTKGLTASSHKGVISLLSEHFAKTGILARYLGKALNNAYDKRLIGDYGVDRTVTKEEAATLFDAAQDFIQQVNDYLDRWVQQK